MDISNNKLDFLFEVVLLIQKIYFFKGDRAIYESEDINSILNSCSSKVISFKKNIYLSKIKPSCLIISRNSFKTIWDHYEYSMLFFVGARMDENIAIESMENKFFLDEILNSLISTLVIYKSFEENVLWVQKSVDINFPDKFDYSF